MLQVVWLETALDELTAAWLEADSALRQAIAAAAHGLEHSLRTSPHEQGESRPHGQRIMFQPPLGVTFEVRQEAGIVRVVHVWIIRPRGRS